jgi:hypothetical protein
MAPNAWICCCQMLRFIRNLGLWCCVCTSTSSRYNCVPNHFPPFHFLGLYITFGLVFLNCACTSKNSFDHFIVQGRLANSEVAWMASSFAVGVDTFSSGSLLIKFYLTALNIALYPGLVLAWSIHLTSFDLLRLGLVSSWPLCFVFSLSGTWYMTHCLYEVTSPTSRA